jgi:hypothetical protein
MRARIGLWVVAGMLAIAPSASRAVPIVYTVTSGGLDGSVICTGTTAVQCANTANHRFTYAPPAAPPNAFDPASGTITFDSAAGTVSVSLTVASATFLAIGDVPDNGVDEVEFTSLAYTFGLSGVTFTPDGFGNTIVSWAAQTPGATSVAGSYEQILNGGNVNGPDAFAVIARVSAGTCTITAANAATCGFVLGRGGFSLNVGPDSTPQSRGVIHTLNVVAVPEPGTALLVGLGVSLVGLRRRSR